MLHALALTVTTALGTWSYILVVGSDPGRVPEGWTPDTLGAAEALTQVKRDGRARCVEVSGWSSCDRKVGAGGDGGGGREDRGWEEGSCEHCLACARDFHVSMVAMVTRRKRVKGGREARPRQGAGLVDPGSRSCQPRAAPTTCRYCTKCCAYKPPRTHHCRRCGRCVLRMDHHCAFASNCVGHGNVRAFLCMCVYLAGAALHAAALLLSFDAALALSALGWDGVRGDGGIGAAEEPGLGAYESWARAGGSFWVRGMAQVAATALVLPGTLGMGMLASWNLWLALRNQTTIEFKEGVRLARVGSGGAAPPRLHAAPWAADCMENLEALCGDSARHWLVPWPAHAPRRGTHHVPVPRLARAV